MDRAFQRASQPHRGGLTRAAKGVFGRKRECFRPFFFGDLQVVGDLISLLARDRLVEIRTLPLRLYTAVVNPQKPVLVLGAIPTLPLH